MGGRRDHKPLLLGPCGYPALPGPSPEAARRGWPGQSPDKSRIKFGDGQDGRGSEASWRQPTHSYRYKSKKSGSYSGVICWSASCSCAAERLPSRPSPDLIRGSSRPSTPRRLRRRPRQRRIVARASEATVCDHAVPPMRRNAWMAGLKPTAVRLKLRPSRVGVGASQAAGAAAVFGVASGLFGA